MQALILFSCLVAAAKAWNCPQLPVVEELDVDRLAGEWYQQSLAGVAFFTQPGGSCTKDIYTVDATNKTLFTFRNAQTVLWQTVEVDGWTNWADPENQNGKLKMTVPTLFLKETADLWVLDTDYDSYAILYSCKKVFGVPGQASWILRRERNPKGAAKEALEDAIKAAFVDIEAAGGPDLIDFVETNQSNCW